MKYTHLSFHKEIWALSSVSTVKLPLKDHLLSVFKLLESHTSIFMRESPVIMCSSLCERFKMMDDRKTATFFLKFVSEQAKLKSIALLVLTNRITVEFKYYNVYFDPSV